MTSLETHRGMLSGTKIDSGRPKGLLLFSLATISTIVASLAAYQSAELVTAIGFLYSAVPLISYSISQALLKKGIRNGRQYWRRDGRSITLTTTRTLILWELGTLVLFSGCLAVGIVLFPLRSRGEWVAPAALLIAGTIGIIYLIPVLKAGVPTRRRISLSSTGVELTQINGHTDEIPWKTHPQLVGVHQGDAIIISMNHHELRYPMSYLPMSMRQLERLLNTFSTDGRLRAKLSGPEALSTVLAVLEPTEEELADSSWTWYSSRTTAKNPQ